ncbi:hypothetical protein DW712_14160 [Bacteroides intestinalis]|uniref:Uncharacterized protein n=1 Tax=Bacteroides intestinalis TaxID=329854 RepID=A0A414L7S9_9BACE|nr:hypothetical protein DW712_14160 [Bacteroides intestinalis]
MFVDTVYSFTPSIWVSVVLFVVSSFSISEEPVAECYHIRAEILKELKMHDEYKADMKEDRQLRKVKDNRYK